MKTALLHEDEGLRTFLLVLQTGDEAIASLTAFVNDHHLNGSHFTALGAFADAVVAYFDWPTRQYQQIPIGDQTEVLSLVGDVTFEQDRPKVHAHVVLGKADGTAHGGHLIAGHVQFNFDQISVALPFIKDGRTRALAVTGTKRAKWLPDVPTFAELGYKDVVGQTFTALLAPAGTPAPVIAKLSAAMTEILRETDVVEKFDLLGAEAAAMTPDELRKYLTAEDAIWMPIVRKANIKAE